MESTVRSADVPGWFTAHAEIRADGYLLLGALLSQPPSEELLTIFRNLRWNEALPESLETALGALRQAGCDYALPALKEEFNKLFVGLGCGEIVPYASWYRERKIQSLPLASLRSDLARLGIVRQVESHESEDHAGALCEIMALISRTPSAVPLATQAAFFQQHVVSWMRAFFNDLRRAKSARFYQALGLFGIRFLECEDEYLKQSKEL